MGRQVRKVISFFIVVLMLLNIGVGIYAEMMTPLEEDGIIDPQVEEFEEEAEDESEEEAEAEEPEDETEEVTEDESVEEAEEVIEEVTEDESEEEIEEVIEEEAEEVDQEADEAVFLIYELDGVTIEISADAGVLPNDTQLSVSALSNSVSKDYANLINETTEANLDNFKAFDITLFDEEGDEVQPNGQVEVSFSGLDFVDASSEIVAYHLKTNDEKSKFQLSRVNKDVEIDELEVEEDNKIVTFNTDHFSIYGVGDTKTATFNFYNDSEKVDTQIVLDGEYLKEPETPTKQAGKKFTGWYMEGETDPIDFSETIRVATPETKRVEARFTEVAYVYFVHDEKIVKTKEVTPGGTTNNKDVPLIILEDGKALDYWSTSKYGAEFDFNTPITEDTTLYAVLADRWKVDFDTQGGSSLLPKYIPDGNTLGEVEAPVRPGYTFQGWYNNAAGTGTRYRSTTVIDSSVKLYAKWKAETSDYSIVYWKENADDTDYTYEETVTKSGLSGSEIVLSDAAGGVWPPRPEGEIYDKRYDYFSFKEYDTGKTIKGDGTTVINVYYSRNEYTLKFNLNRLGSKLTIGGEAYTGSEYEFTAKYESDISDLWPTASNIPDVGNYKFTGWDNPGHDRQTSKVLVLTSNYLSTSGTKTFTGSWSRSVVEYRLHYMIESLSGSGDKEYGSGSNKKWYSEDLAYSQTVNYSSNTNWGAKQLPGVSKIDIQQAGRNGGDVYFYYDRNAYNLEFFNPSLISDKKETIKYGSSISDKSFTPPRPAGVSEDYEFKGWFTNPDGEGNPFKFTDAKMPENNLALYAKWAPPAYSLKYYLTPDNTGEFERIDDIVAGETISENQLVGKTIPDGLTEEDFAGWYWYLDGTFVPYDFNTPVINNNYELYPVWKGGSYEVSYDAGGGSGPVPEDGNTYLLGAAANVLPAGEDLIAPSGSDKVFIGWKEDDSNKIYYPNDKLIITGNMTLTAQWGEIVPDTKITYNANGGVGDDVVDELQNNFTHTVKENTFTRVNYEFVGWNTQADGSGDSYRAGDDVIVSNPADENILYAQWEINTGGLTLSKKVTGNAGDKSRYFQIFVTFTGLEGTGTDNTISIDLENATYEDNPTAITLGEKTSFWLKDGEKVEFSNLPYGVDYTVEEYDYTGEGYDPVDITEGKIENENTTVEVTNNKEVIIDTGISFDNLPYIILLALAGIGALGIFIWRRKYKAQ